MASVPFSWMWGDPAENIDRLRAMQGRMAVAEKVEKERLRIKKSRRIRKLVKLAIAGKLRGQSRG